MANRDGTGPAGNAGGARNGSGNGKGRRVTTVKGAGKKTGGKKGSC